MLYVTRTFTAATLFFYLFCVSYTQGQDSLEINKITVNYKAVKLPLKNQTLLLTSSNNDVVIEFKPLAGDAVFYHYRINEATKWHISQFPVIQFYDLAGGDYQIEIKAQTLTGFTKSLHLTIIKDEAFYQEWFFWPSIGIYILLIFGIAAYLFFLYDFRNKLKVQHIRNQIASDLHDEVGSNLNSIAIFIEVLRKKVAKVQPELASILDRITANSEETVSLMRETVWAINPDNDSTEKLFERMKSLGFEVLSVKKIDFIYENTIENDKLSISMEQRRNLYLIYKEAINNIVKHANATKVWVNIIKENNRLKIDIQDNGCGFDKNEIFEGNGLKNFENRGKSNGIDIKIDSEPKKGTKVAMMATVE